MDAFARGVPRDHTIPSAIALSTNGLWWDSTGTPTISLARPRDDDTDFWLIGRGQDALGAMYIFASSQDSTSAKQCVAFQHNSGLGSMTLDIMRTIRGTTWAGTFNTDVTSNRYSWIAAVLMRGINGFRGISAAVARHSAYGTGITMTTPANPLGRPGGIYVAVAHFDSGGSGISGFPAAPYQNTGAYGLGALAWYILPQDQIITPPNASFSAGRTNDWSGITAYLT